MKSSKKRSRAVVTVVACILAVCLVAALVLFSLEKTATLSSTRQ